jgi:hypothetical protein
VSFAGLIDCEVNVSEGRDRAAAQTLDDEDEGGLAGPPGEEGEVMPWPFFGFWRCNCRAFASAFSCVRTKYAKFWNCVSVCLADAQSWCLAPL